MKAASTATDTQSLESYRLRRAGNNATGMGAVYLMRDGSVSTGMSVLARFATRLKGDRALKAAGFRKGMALRDSTTFYVS